MTSGGPPILEDLNRTMEEATILLEAVSARLQAANALEERLLALVDEWLAASKRQQDELVALAFISCAEGVIRAAEGREVA